MSLFKTVADSLRALLTFLQTQEQNKREMEEMREEMRRMSSLLQMGLLQMKHGFEAERNEREKLLLQLENEMLKFERKLDRRLPPSKNRQDEDE